MATRREKDDLQELRQRLQTSAESERLRSDGRVEQSLDQLGSRRSEAPSGQRTAGGAWLAWFFSIAALLVALGSAYFSFQSYQTFRAMEEELRSQLADVSSRLQTLQESLETSRQRIGSVKSDLSTVQTGFSRSQAQIAQARRLVEQIRLNQEQQRQLLDRQIAAKADSNQVVELKETSQTKFEEIDGQLSDVTKELESNRQELEKTWKEMEKLGLRLTDQGRLIATNLEGLQELRSQQSDRDYREFDVRRDLRVKVGDIALEVRKTNRDKQYADIRLLIDDRNVNRDKIYVNSPLVFYVGPDRVEYELVINEVQKNRILGYVSILTSSNPTK